MINETDDIDGIVKCIMEDGFESGLTSMRIFFMMLCWAMMKMIMKKNFKVKC